MLKMAPRTIGVGVGGIIPILLMPSVRGTTGVGVGNVTIGIVTAVMIEIGMITTTMTVTMTVAK
jgi:hypothetical protein